MRELNVNEIEQVSGGGLGSWFGGWMAGNGLNWAVNHAWENRGSIGAWAYNNGRFRRSMP